MENKHFVQLKPVNDVRPLTDAETKELIDWYESMEWCHFIYDNGEPMNNVEYNGTVVLDVGTEDDMRESMGMIRKLLRDGYTVDIHPHMNEDCDVEFLLIDIYDENLSSEKFAANYHAAAKVTDEDDATDEKNQYSDGIFKKAEDMVMVMSDKELEKEIKKQFWTGDELVIHIAAQKEKLRRQKMPHRSE